jgi:hypothetical protein
MDFGDLGQVLRALFSGKFPGRLVHGLRQIRSVQMKAFRHDSSCHALKNRAITNWSWYYYRKWAAKIARLGK